MTLRADCCMFCLRSDRAFRSEEHVLPQALGNTELLVPRGVICDTCNNEQLSTCDQALVSCPPIALLRATRFIRGKKRSRLPRAEFGEAGVYPVDDGTDGNVYLRIPDEASFVDHGGEFEVELVRRFSERQWSLVSRAILKAGFEMLAVDHGKEYVMAERFDGLRRWILEGGHRGWVMFSNTVTPSDDLSVSRREVEIAGTTRTGLSVTLVVMGVRFATAWPAREDLLLRAPPEIDLENVRIQRFAREASEEPAEVTMNVSVTYGSKGGDWADGTPVSAAIDEIDARRARRGLD